MPRPLELLAPARNAEVGRQALLHGADAVYIGGPTHGARAAAANSVDDIALLVQMAHLYGACVYVTLNTIIYDDELSDVERDIRQLYDVGVDALIVQDMSILRMDIPPIDLHASTQCDIRTPQRAAMLSRVGFSQLVLPREMSLDQIREVAAAVRPGTTLEAFVHGALCVCYSGDCQASWLAKGRSANRGECAQMCRLPYNLVDGDGRVLMRDKHLLSLRDLNRLRDIGRMADAGVSSFKIEGRLKDVSYIKQTVSAYRQAIDRLIADHPDRYCRASLGRTRVSFEADVDQAFNRGFTPYFIDGRPARHVSMACLDSPKWTGNRVGVVTGGNGRWLRARLECPLNNGDGLGYYGADGAFAGFRLNRAEGDRLFPAAPLSLPVGTVLYRNHDARLEAMLARPTAQRLIDVTMRLELDDGRLRLTVVAEGDVRAVASADAVTDQAKTPQGDQRHRVLSKLGGTPFVLTELRDCLSPDTFVPASLLTTLRQQAVELLQRQMALSHKRRQRLPEDPAVTAGREPLDYHANVANDLAERFYADHGATVDRRALEVCPPDRADRVVVMTTRYCIRRELGACLRQPGAGKLPEPLYLLNDSARYRLRFDCADCCMRLVREC